MVVEEVVEEEEKEGVGEAACERNKMKMTTALTLTVTEQGTLGNRATLALLCTFSQLVTACTLL